MPACSVFYWKVVVCLPFARIIMWVGNCNYMDTYPGGVCSQWTRRCGVTSLRMLAGVILNHISASAAVIVEGMHGIRQAHL